MADDWPTLSAKWFFKGEGRQVCGSILLKEVKKAVQSKTVVVLSKTASSVADDNNAISMCVLPLLPVLLLLALADIDREHVPKRSLPGAWYIRRRIRLECPILCRPIKVPKLPLTVRNARSPVNPGHRNGASHTGPCSEWHSTLPFPLFQLVDSTRTIPDILAV